MTEQQKPDQESEPGPYLRKDTGGWYGNFEKFAAFDGRREPLVPTGAKRATKDKAVADRLFKKRLAQLEQMQEAADKLGVDKLFTVHDVAQRWLKKNKKKFSEGHRENSIRGAEALGGLHTYLGPRWIQTVTRAEITEAIDRFRAENPDLSDNTVRQRCITLGSIFKFARRSGWTTENVVEQHPSIPDIEPGNRYCPPARDMAALIELCVTATEPARRAPSLYATIMVVAHTGARINEAVRMRVKDINFQTKRVRVPASKQGRRKEVNKRDHRMVPLFPALEAFLRSWIATHEMAYDDLLLPSVSEGQQSTNSGRGVHRACERARIEPTFNYHSMRHAYATARIHMVQAVVNGIQSAVSVKTVANEIGHMDSSITESTYYHEPEDTVPLVDLDWRVLAQMLGERDRARMLPVFSNEQDDEA